MAEFRWNPAERPCLTPVGGLPLNRPRIPPALLGEPVGTMGAGPRYEHVSYLVYLLRRCCSTCKQFRPDKFLLLALSTISYEVGRSR